MVDLVVRDPTQLGKGADAATAVVARLIAHFVGVFQHAFIRSVHVKVRYATDNGIGDDGVQVGANHTGAVARAGPFGKPAALAIGLDPALDDFCQSLGVEQGEQRVDRAVSIPEAVVGVEHARMQFSVVGAVVVWLSALIVFIEGARKEMGAIETGVKRMHLSIAGSLDLDAI